MNNTNQTQLNSLLDELLELTEKYEAAIKNDEFLEVKKKLRNRLKEIQVQIETLRNNQLQSSE